MLKTKYKKNLIMCSIFSITLSIPTIAISCSSNSQKINLSKNEVINNFQKGNKWEGKLYLTHSDFDNYLSIDYDAFDNIENNLEFIELPSSMIINVDSKKPIIYEIK